MAHHGRLNSQRHHETRRKELGTHYSVYLNNCDLCHFIGWNPIFLEPEKFNLFKPDAYIFSQIQKYFKPLPLTNGLCQQCQSASLGRAADENQT